MTQVAPLLALQHLQRQAAGLLLYPAVLRAEPAIALLDLLDQLNQMAIAPVVAAADHQACLRAYGRWFQALAAQGQSWQTWLLSQLLWDVNPLATWAQRHGHADLPPSLVAAAQQDLRSLQSFFALSGYQVAQWVAAAVEADPIPVWTTDESAPALDWLRSRPIWQHMLHSPDWSTQVFSLADHYHCYGTGNLAQYRAFRWQQGALVGIPHHDPIQLAELTEYDLPRQALIQNTEALLAGYPALHTLLYGSRGSGKSSLVKALLNEYGDRGLRLVEVPKADLGHLPTIVDKLRDAPQRFIIFVDDLSFEEDDDAFKSLKVVLEGGVTARPANLVVYATSNRRHLIREFHSDRPRPSDADEIHAWDTLQEKLSFSDRFGLTLTFEPADQPTYLAIVQHLAQRAQIELSPQALESRALQWATRHNGRSGRTARQFVDALRAELMLAQSASQ